MAEVVAAMRRLGTSYAEQTIRTHIGSVMCIDAPSNHAVAYPDLERVDRGRYRLVASESQDQMVEPITAPGGLGLIRRGLISGRSRGLSQRFRVFH